MEIINTDLEDKTDKVKLRQFLEACHESALEDGHFKIASIAMDVKHIDPLAVLDSIYEAEAEHCYLEHPQGGWAVAGAEAIVRGEWSGPDRFKQVKEFADEVVEHTIGVGQMDNPFTGPLFFCGLSFYDEVSDKTPFPAAFCFVPQWQVGRQSGRYTAVANVRIDPEGSVEDQVERIWAAHEKFTAFDYASTGEAPNYRLISETEMGGAGVYETHVRDALGRIKCGKYDKIVLSRALEMEFDNETQPLRTLNRLRQKFGGCRIFSLQEKTGTSFIGATPERLLNVSFGKLSVDAIAGSAARDEEAGADARFSRELLNSEKDLREHRHVISSIERRLKSLGIQCTYSGQPQLLILPNVQHLYTPITGDLDNETHLMDVAAVLHPTPAVGGTPRTAALKDIAELESFERGMFAGLVGYFDYKGNGELCVGIRSALMQGKRARIFAGAGIVAGSEASRELAETDMKMQALRDALAIVE